MKKLILTSIAATVLLSTSVLAYNCPDKATLNQALIKAIHHVNGLTNQPVTIGEIKQTGPTSGPIKQCNFTISNIRTPINMSLPENQHYWGDISIATSAKFDAITMVGPDRDQHDPKAGDAFYVRMSFNPAK